MSKRLYEEAGKRLYVGGLSYEVDDVGLKGLFSSIGMVSYAKVIRDFNTRRSKGFGFIEMSSPQEAAEAIRKLHGTLHEGRVITVAEANPPEGGNDREGRRGGGGNGGGGYGGRRGGGGGGRNSSNDRSHDRYNQEESQED